MRDSSQTRVEAIMSTPLETISADATLTEATTAMREEDISALLVTTAPPSIVTSTDVLDAVAEGRDPDDVRVEDVMTESVETVPPDLRLGEVAAMMTNFGISHLPVVDDDYLGMVSSTDITARMA
ncbi:CBS domain-containing protein [Halomicrobium salinisoli]|uniref:CBS domain-containing protein n=1 Tax=Halomicrobium salinisoli TaxID=2878391 RepID=UPI001CF0AE5D|nr:CBS domain-containing protein [Halomicrobium salinisoli]